MRPKRVDYFDFVTFMSEMKSELRQDRLEIEQRIAADRKEAEKRQEAAEARLAADRKEAEARLAADRKEAEKRQEATEARLVQERAEARKDFNSQRRWLIANFVAVVVCMMSIFFAILLAIGILQF